MNIALPVAPPPEYAAYAQPAQTQAVALADPVRAADVAAYLLARLGTMQQLRLQKLLFYCQAWRVAYAKPRLFDDPIEAWAAGPVVPAVWRDHAYEYMIESEPNGDQTRLSLEQKLSIDAVLDRYAGFTGEELSQLTHREDPWKIARNGLPEGVRGSRLITVESMGDFYGRLLHDNANAAVAVNGAIVEEAAVLA